MSKITSVPVLVRDGDLVLYAPVAGVAGVILTAPRIDAARLRAKLASRVSCAAAVAALAAAPGVAATAPIKVESGSTSRPPAGFTLGEAMGLTQGFAALAALARGV